MIHLKENPVGIDLLIQKLQKKLNHKISYDGMHSFGRVYLNEIEGKLVPEYYKGNGEYKEVLLNDRINGNIFFIEDGTTKKKSSQLITPISLIILLDLEKLSNINDKRIDEEVKTEIYSIIETEKYFQLDEIIKGNDVLKGFKTDLKEIHPYCFLRFNGTMRYQGIY
ncbi:conserved protein of unknown function [Tenacibaculum sp. 190524A02b]|uniref:hypothetical protein n=1 Tax=Tenacibaculum vairaonense TaxID=3137860 RepID=UPI0032B25797